MNSIMYRRYYNTFELFTGLSYHYNEKIIFVSRSALTLTSLQHVEVKDRKQRNNGR